MLGSIMLPILSSRDIRLAYLSLLFWGGEGGEAKKRNQGGGALHTLKQRDLGVKLHFLFERTPKRLRQRQRPLL